MTRANLLTGATVALLFAFTFPAWVGLFALVTGQFRGDTEPGRLFFLTLFQPNGVWGLIRTGLAVVIAAVAALGLSQKISLHSGIVIIALLIMFLPLVVLFVYLLDPDHSGLIWAWVRQPQLKAPIESAEAFDQVWNGYLTGQLQVLATHLALFFGLRRTTK